MHTAPTIFIGDVHGCLTELKLLWAKLKTHLKSNLSHARIIFLGDLIGKGPNVKAVLAWVHARQATVLMGNHEFHYLASLGDLPHAIRTHPQLYTYASPFSSKKTTHATHAPIHPPPPLPPANNATAQNLRQDWGEPLHAFIRSFPLYVAEEKFIAVHAGMHPHRALAHSDPYLLVNVRTLAEKPWYSWYNNEKPIVYGHWAQQGLHIQTHKKTHKPTSIGLDSGCVYGGHLSAYILETHTLIQVPAKKAYAPIP